MTTTSYNAVPQGTSDVLRAGGWFLKPGAYAIVDGQFGSTGKGLASSVLAAYSITEDLTVNYVTSNQGPNAGHTGIINSYLPGTRGIVMGFHKVWKQLPIFTGVYEHYQRPITTYLNGGAVIDMEILRQELSEIPFNRGRVVVHPHAAVVLPRHTEDNLELTARVASTGKGTGFAAADKAMRRGDVSFAFNNKYGISMSAALPFNVPRYDVGVIEVPQGYSLGANAGFWPTCTHRECTVAQGLADAQLSPKVLQKTMMVIRTYPIRVGNTQGSSGGCYSDQEETTWEEIGQAPEFTTVTKRMRRVFTFSMLQVLDAAIVNQPDIILFNFANYMKFEEFKDLFYRLRDRLREVLGYTPQFLFGYGPASQDVFPSMVPNRHRGE